MDYDLFVIGAGSGGVRAARMAAGFGARVAVAEDRYMGGTCVNVGCVPKKLYVYASEFSHAFADSKGFGWNSEAASFNWAILRDNKKDEISRLNGIYRNMLAGVEVDTYDGRATLVDAHTVAVNGQQFSAEKIVIATGGWPFIPSFPGSDLAVTSNEIFDLKEFPERIAVVGGGYIAVEFAGIFNGLGSKVTQLYRGPLFLRGFDSDIRAHAAQEIAKSGVDLRFDLNVDSISRTDEGLQLELTDGSSITVDAVLYATGRKPHLDGLGLENVSVDLTANGTIAVDEYFNTSEPSIFALGDVIGGMELTPVALAEGMSFARRQFDNLNKNVEYDFIPTAVFCQPNIGTVGFTEEAARAEFGNVTLFKSTFTPMKHTISGRDEKTFMKMIVDTVSDKVVGIHMMGPDAGEIIQGLAIAMKAGATKAMFDSTIGIHPTAAEEFVTMREPWTGGLATVEPSLWQAVLLVFVGGAAGFLNVMAGGGSLLTVPVMIFMGIPGPVANGTNRVAILAQNLSAITAFFKRGFSDFKLSLSLAACAIPGAVLGALLGVQLHGVLFNRILAVIMVGVMIIMYFDKGHSKDISNGQPTRSQLIRGHILMIGVGFWGGFIQIGVGFIIMPVLNRVMGLDLIRTNMHKVFIVATYTIAALAVFASQVPIFWMAGASLALGTSVGGYIGAHMTVSRGEQLIRNVLNVVLIAFIIKLLFFS